MAEALDPILPERIDALASQVLTEASRRGFSLAAAESCTGGLLASLLTDLPGRSHAFDRGFVVYTDRAKAEMLGVPPDLLARFSAISEPVARAMAEGALARSVAEIALAITGWAEGGPDPSKPAGLVWFASARRLRETRTREARFGDIGRARLRIACLEVGLSMMLDRMGG
ncbi:MAG: CinA family protein [Caulobacteraceae bacterium]